MSASAANTHSAHSRKERTTVGPNRCPLRASAVLANVLPSLVSSPLVRLSAYDVRIPLGTALHVPINQNAASAQVSKFAFVRRSSCRRSLSSNRSIWRLVGHSLPLHDRQSGLADAERRHLRSWDALYHVNAGFAATIPYEQIEVNHT